LLTGVSEVEGVFYITLIKPLKVLPVRHGNPSAVLAIVVHHIQGAIRYKDQLVVVLEEEQVHLLLVSQGVYLPQVDVALVLMAFEDLLDQEHFGLGH
jgi:hypothetical protein